MKGIQKLFLGLFLMALISVGFKVETKAAVADRPSATCEFDGSNLKFSFDCTSTAFPIPTADDNESRFKYVCTIKAMNGTTEVGTVDTVTVLLKITGKADPTPDVYKYSYQTSGAATPTEGDGSDVTIATKLMTRSELNTKIESFSGLGDKVDLKVFVQGSAEGQASSLDPVSSFSSDPIFAAAKVTLRATYDGTATFPKGAQTVTFKDDLGETLESPFYLVKGVVQPVRIKQAPGKGYKINKWTKNDDVKSTSSDEYDLTMDVEKPVTLTVNYIQNTDAVKITTFEGLKVLAGKESNKRNYDFSAGGYSFDDIEGIYIGGTSVGKNNYGGGQMTITAPSSAAKGKMTVKMSDGLTYTVANTAEVISKVYITLASSYNFSPDETYTITPGTSPVPDDIEYSFSTDPSSFLDAVEDSNNNLVITTKKNATGSTTLTAKAKFSNIEGGTSGTAEATATAPVTVESLTIKDGIFVNKGLSILLSKFIKSGSSSAETRVTQYPDLIKVDPTNGKVDGIKISGESAGTKDDSLVVSTQTSKIDVTVYPSPTLSVETSTSGPYKYTVKVPKGLYHDNVFVSEVNKAILEFKAIDHDDKTKTVTIDSLSDDSDNKLLKKGTKSIELKDLNKYIKDIAKDTDTQTIQVRAYAYNKDKDEKDDKVYSEKKEFTVYKINLDTSGNASYTVNGENVGGYFYGISDATYTIKSSATNGGKLDTTKSGDFNSGESISYKVLGARTLKAVYNASGSNANANGAAGAGMDGYDDVPKTGESRADIWILWSVLLISILGAGFMIWKRFGLVRAIAAADREMAAAAEQERVEAEKKAEKDKMDMLKDLRNL